MLDLQIWHRRMLAHGSNREAACATAAAAAAAGVTGGAGAEGRGARLKLLSEGARAGELDGGDDCVVVEC